MVAINKYCPRSGKPVEPGSMTLYRNHTVGFCNPGCRDSFQAEPQASPKDCQYFDCLIKEKN